MIVALELCGLTKRFTAGAGGCIASVDVLRGVSLCVAAGESFALVGASGAGKSTLLLCAAGLLSHDAGEMHWFGEAGRAVAARRAVYHCTQADLLYSRPSDDPVLHLLDLQFGADGGRNMASWVGRHCDAGDAVIVATRDEDLAHHLASRVVVLRSGRLYPDARPRSRVAERARR
jgi:ABC-type sulfate/molybdate transport systems ATPase subunit